MICVSLKGLALVLLTSASPVSHTSSVVITETTGNTVVAWEHHPERGEHPWCRSEIEEA